MADSIARRFVNARLKRQSLAEFPGPLPPDLPFAYQCQVAAIRLWPDRIAGWKVGSIRGQAAEDYGCNRLLGPIFKKSVRRFSAGQCLTFSAFSGGFAAVEPEYVFKLVNPLRVNNGQLTQKELEELVDKVFFGVEIAGSPFPGINDLGPPVVVSDFGNNDGLVLGPELQEWKTTPLEEWRAALKVDGSLKGSGSVFELEGGPFESLRFAMKQARLMGFPLQGGSLVSTGAITGVHRVHYGQYATAEFHGGVHVKILAGA